MIIAFAHYKGGTGKTTSCLSVAGYLARFGRKVLVVDLDPQGNATSGLGIDKKGVNDDMAEVMAKKKKLADVIVETDVEGLHLAPASNELALMNIKSYQSATQAKVLERALAKVKGEYDFILIDTPPVHSHFIINGMAAADKVFVVLDPGIFALEGIETLKNTFGKFFKKMGLDLNIEGAIVTKYQTSILPWKKNFSREIRDNVIGILDKGAYAVPYSEDIFETHVRGLPISHFKPRSRVGRAYKEVALNILKAHDAEEYY